ncbi:MAG: STAS/SEC14 domain-containing protein [Bacteroidota bacterium]
MEKFVIFEKAEWPLVIGTFTGQKADVANFDLYLEEMTALYHPKVPFSIIFDATHAKVLPPAMIKKQADWMENHQEIMVNYLSGIAYVIPSSIMRGILRAIFSLQKQPSPYTVVPDVQEARDWVNNLPGFSLTSTS